MIFLELFLLVNVGFSCTRWVIGVSILIHVVLFFKIHFFKNKSSSQATAGNDVTCTRNLGWCPIFMDC